MLVNRDLRTEEQLLAAYEKAHHECANLAAEIHAHIFDLPAPDSDDLNWGHVGDANRIAAMLRGCLEIIKGTQA